MKVLELCELNTWLGFVELLEEAETTQVTYLGVTEGEERSSSKSKLWKGLPIWSSKEYFDETGESISKKCPFINLRTGTTSSAQTPKTKPKKTIIFNGFITKTHRMVFAFNSK